MNIVIPMAGRGSRLRPHTLTVPKPLLPVAGKPMVEHLLEDLIRMCPEKIEHVGFVIGDFGEEVKQELEDMAARHGVKGHVYRQHNPQGTAQAVLCAEELMNDKLIIALADTLFDPKDELDMEQEGCIYVERVEDPSAFGVVNLDKDGFINQFVEKPKEPISDLAIIGIYYFRHGKTVKAAMQRLLDEDIRVKGEYQITTALQDMMEAGMKMGTAEVAEWLDCGNKGATVNTNSRVLELKKKSNPSGDYQLHNALVIEPCSIGEGVVIEESIVGPNVAIGAGSVIKRSVISHSLIQKGTILEGLHAKDSMIGSNAQLRLTPKSYDLGDYSRFDA